VGVISSAAIGRFRDGGSARYSRGFQVGGRIEQVLVREGDKVEAGQVLATFDDRELKATMDASLANFQKLQRGFRPEEVEQVRAQAAQAKADYELRRNGNRKEDIDAAQADADRARADTVRTESTWKRVSDLSNQDVFSKQQRDDAEGAWKNAVARNAPPKKSSPRSGTASGLRKWLGRTSLP